VAAKLDGVQTGKLFEQTLAAVRRARVERDAEQIEPDLTGRLERAR